MVRRVYAFCAFFLFLVSASHVLIAQVYPDREELDVVRLIDGTILKGVILEQVPDRYLEIQLYGGSTFVLGYEQIESVEQEANPDYGTTWIKIDLGALDTAPTGTTTTATTRDSGPRPLSAGGHLVSLYSFGFLTSSLSPPINVGGPTGDNWENTLSDLNIDEQALQKNENDALYAGGGIAYTWWKLLGVMDITSSIWGIRGSVGLHSPGFEVDEDTGDTEPRKLYLEGGTGEIPIIVEGLIGISGDRVALLAGLGIGGGVSIGSGLSYYEEDGNISDYGSIAQGFSPMYSASLSGLFRLGRRWVAEAGVWANGQFENPFDEGVIFRGWGERIALGYRFGGK